MPYTLSHVAVVVPVSRLLARMRVLSAVIIGSMVPDFGYMLPTQPSRFETHSLMGLATFCLPVGLLWYWLFQGLMKTPLVSVLSDATYARWQAQVAPAPWRSPRQWLLAVCGILAGALVHLGWDAFTHEGARGVRMLPELADPMLEVHDHLVTGATLLQGLSSLVGLLIVVAAIIYAVRGGRHAPVGPRELTPLERRSWVLVFLVATLGCCIGFSILDRFYNSYNILHHRWLGLGVWAVALLRSLIVAAVLVSLLLQGYLWSKRK